MSTNITTFFSGCLSLLFVTLLASCKNDDFEGDVLPSFFTIVYVGESGLASLDGVYELKRQSNDFLVVTRRGSKETLYIQKGSDFLIKPWED